MSNTIVQITGSFEDWLKRKYGNDPENAKTLDSIDMAECWKLVAEKAKDDLANIDNIKKSIWGTNCKEFTEKLNKALERTKEALEGRTIPSRDIEVKVENKVENYINEEVKESFEESTENNNKDQSIESENTSEEVEDINLPTHEEDESKNNESVLEETLPVNDEESDNKEIENEINTEETTNSEEENIEDDLEAYTKAFEAEVAALRNGQNNTENEE